MEPIANVLNHGECKALKAEQIRKLLNYSSTRDVTAEVERERGQGVPILSTRRGYFLPSGAPEQAARELKHFIAAMNGRRAKIQASTKAAVEELNRIESANTRQLSFWDYLNG